MSGENTNITKKKPEDKVKESIVVIQEYMKEHNLSSHSFKGHADVFFNELKCYMKLSQKGRNI